MNSYLFLSDKHCVVKITDFSLQDMSEDVLDRGLSRGAKNPNLTTGIYTRSIIVAKKTLINHSLGWGIDGMDNANHNLLKDYGDPGYTTESSSSDYGVEWSIPDKKKAFFHYRFLNLKDGLSNLLKMFTEFGIFTFIILFYFTKYMVNIKNITTYDLFIITLFITLSIRGAGYFNGGYIFCLLEFFYYNKFKNNLKFVKEN